MVVLLASCGPGQPTYLDRVKALPADQAHPQLQELLPLLQHPADRNPEDLMRTWNEFLGDTLRPIHKGSVYTFVYYDFTKTLDQVFLEASFSPTRMQPLLRVGTTALFYRVFDIPRPDRLKYRFSDGKSPLVDPFHPEVIPGAELWQEAVDPPDGTATVQKVVGAAEALLVTQDVQVVLPPMYRRNLAWTYPLVVVVGLDGDEWARPLAQVMDQISVRPFLAISLGTKQGQPWTVTALKPVLEGQVLPWFKSHYRVSPDSTDVVLVGWGSSVKAVQELAAGRQETWPKIRLPGVSANHNEEDWNGQAQTWIKAEFPTVAP